MDILITESQYKTLNEKLTDITGVPLYHFTHEHRALQIMYKNALHGSRPDEDLIAINALLR